MDPALMLLAVFAGIGMFGFFGIIIGPVLMIIIVDTIAAQTAALELRSGGGGNAHPGLSRRPRRHRRRAEHRAVAVHV